MELTFVRHTSVAVPKGMCYGVSDVPLSDTFDSEAQAVKASLKGKKFDAVYSSPLSRCRRLAEYCCSQPIIFDDRLLEINFGDWEMQMFDNIADPRLQEWYADYANVRATGGESFMDQNYRVRSFLNEIAAKDYNRVAVFAHGGILIQAMLIRGMASLDNCFERQPKYGDILEISL